MGPNKGSREKPRHRRNRSQQLQGERRDKRKGHSSANVSQKKKKARREKQPQKESACRHQKKSGVYGSGPNAASGTRGRMKGRGQQRCKGWVMGKINTMTTLKAASQQSRADRVKGSPGQKGGDKRKAEGKLWEHHHASTKKGGRGPCPR